jgi:hypothetical protein
MGEKLISKNHLTPPLPALLSKFRSRINENQGMVLGKFQSGARPHNFKIFFIYTLCRWIFVPVKAKILRFLSQKQKFCLSRDQNQ